MSLAFSTPPSPDQNDVCILDADRLDRMLQRLAHEIVEHHRAAHAVVVAGIERGGSPLAATLATRIGELTGTPIPLASLQVEGFRDDERRLSADATVWSAGDDAPTVEGATIVLVDDVIETGRTVRAALDALASVGRPAAVELAVLIDRGGRELPMRPTYVGKNIPASAHDWVDVRVSGVPPQSAGAYLVPR